MYARLLRNFMDVLILAKLTNDELSGYDVFSYINEEFDILISPGTVYSVLYSMERDGLIKSRLTGGKRIFALTDRGESTVKAICNSSSNIQDFIAKLLASAHFRSSSNDRDVITASRKASGTSMKTR